jgi:hypothetical protein
MARARNIRERLNRERLNRERLLYGSPNETEGRAALPMQNEIKRMKNSFFLFLPMLERVAESANSPSEMSE